MYKLSKTNIFFSRFEGTRGEKNPTISHPRLENLRLHIRCVHDKAKPFPCSICSSSFSTKSHLVRHIKQVHEGRKPHQCTICEASFHQKSGLLQHISGVHEKAKPFPCPQCDKGTIYLFFSSSRSLKARKKRISFAQFVYFLRVVCLRFNF